MVSNYWRLISWPMLVGALGLPVLMDCGKMPGGMPGVPNVPGAPGNCPDMANADAVASFDWQKEFKLDAAHAQNINSWVGVIHGWVNQALRACDTLHDAALEELLLTEGAMAEHARASTSPVPAPRPSTVPAEYDLLLPGADRPRPNRLSWWQRFQLADGLGKRTLTVANRSGHTKNKHTPIVPATIYPGYTFKIYIAMTPVKSITYGRYCEFYFLLFVGYDFNAGAHRRSNVNSFNVNTLKRGWLSCLDAGYHDLGVFQQFIGTKTYFSNR